MSSLPFLLEIGCEEVPDWMIVPALQNLKELFETLGVGNVTRVDATPRRLVLWAGPLLDRQPDSEEVVIGPPKSAGAGAANGFARKMGVTPDQLGTESTPKGEYFSFLKKTAGRPTADILADKLPEIIGKIQWPKTMYWTIPGAPLKGGPRFIRPIRWLVALLGDEVVRFTYGDVQSGATTRGHRILSNKAIPVTIANYEEDLRKTFVIVSAKDRQARIVESIAGKNAKADRKLLDTLTYITEYPTAIEGGFDPEYLKLPKEVLVMVMRYHQKYFSVEDASGELAPKFLAVMNTGGDPDGLVQKGNERVLRARFNDARFFWDVDQRKKIAERVDDLKTVTFQRDLGAEKSSYFAKTERVVALVKELGGDADAQRAARLAKCDLATEMVKEFTDLQGIMGGLYAKHQGEAEPVWRAIYEHYKPLSMEDSIPATLAGRLVALADKLDTLRGCFAIGLIPTGSKDPFALRRAAQGVVKILVEGGIATPMQTLLGANAALQDFLAERLKYYFRDVRGFAYDEVNAVMAAGWSSLPDVEARLTRVSRIRSTPDFEPLAASFKRMKNIVAQASFVSVSAVNKTLLEDGPERELHAEFQKISGQPFEQAAGSLRPKLDTFFEKILVNAPDEAVRNNRLTLLSQILNEFSTIADFSEIVTSKEV